MGAILKVRDTDGTVHEIHALQGKSAYQYAVEGGFTGTEAEFAAKLAAEKLPNPNALTFTGAATGSYDGSEVLTVEIPSGGGGGTEREWTQLANVDLSTIVGGSIELTNLDNYTDFYILWDTPRNDSTKASGFSLSINDIGVADFAVPILNSSSNSSYGWTKANYDGLIWNVQKSGGATKSTLHSLSNVNAQLPYCHVLDVGKATKFKLSRPSIAYAAVSGIITIYGR